MPHLTVLAIAYLFALPIGWNREREERSAGLRTFPLVAVSCCGFVQAAEVRLRSADIPWSQADRHRRYTCSTAAVSIGIDKRPVPGYSANQPCGRITTLITPSSLSRNLAYISGASSRLAGWVITKLGSIAPATIFSNNGLV